MPDATQETMEKLSMAQRMLTAKKRRQEQVNQYLIREKWQDVPDVSSTTGKNKRKRSVSYDPIALIFEAVIRNDLYEVVQLLKNGICDTDSANCYGITPLHQACIDRNLSMVHLLVKEFNADVNKHDHEKWSPLHSVALFGFADVANFLLNNGADVLALNIDLNMPYDLCDDSDTLDVIESSMASKGVTQEKIELMRKVGERKMLKELQHNFSSGRYPGLKFNGGQGESLLHIACANGYYEVANFLISKAKHPISCFDNDLWQPIHAAAYWQQVDLMELLIGHDADIFVRNNEGENAIDLCRDEELKEWMIETYNRHIKKDSKSISNSLKEKLKKNSKHHFNSSVSLKDLTNLSSKRLNTEKKEKKQKKDKEDEYKRMISSREMYEEEMDDNEVFDANNNFSSRKASVNTPSPIVGRIMADNKLRRFSDGTKNLKLSKDSSFKSVNEFMVKKRNKETTVSPLAVNPKPKTSSSSDYIENWQIAQKFEKTRRESKESRAVRKKSQQSDDINHKASSLEREAERKLSAEKNEKSHKNNKKATTKSLTERPVKKKNNRRCTIS